MERRADGFSLIEMMVAVLILAVITSQLFLVLSTQKRAYTSEVRDLDLQETARQVADMIAFDTRNAGMMVPREAAVASANGGAAQPDRFCVSRADYFNPASPTGSWDNRTDRFGGATVDAVNSATDLVLSTLNIDGTDGVDDFGPQGRGVIVAHTNGRDSVCDVLAADPAGNSIRLLYGDPRIQATWAGAAVAVPAHVYEIVPSAQGPILQRDGVQVSSLIEDLQVEYWVDSGPGTPNGLRDGGEWPIHSLAGLVGGGTNADGEIWTPLSRIRNVRISVLAASDVADVDSQGLARYRRPAIADRDAGANSDSLVRRHYVINVLPRNLLDPGMVADVD